MGVVQWLVLAVSAVVIALSIYLYSPALEGVEDPQLVQVYVASWRLAELVASVMQAATGISALSYLRGQIEMVYTPILTTTSSKVQVDSISMEGVRVHIYRPQAKTSDLLPAVVYFHGGGWSLFSINSYDTVTRRLSENTGLVVISVEYRLAPEFPYPIPFDECVKVTRHVLHHGDQYLVDSNKVAVAGDGTGGNLAAAVALRLSEENTEHTPAVKLQILIQPVLQVLTFNTPSYRENAYNAIVDRVQMIKYWCNYLGIEPSSSAVSSLLHGRHISPSARRMLYLLHMKDAEKIGRQASGITTFTKNPDLDEIGHDPDVSQAGAGVENRAQDPFLAPIMAESVSRCPSTLILVGERDIVRDDGLVYAQKLKQAGVNVTLHHLKGRGQGHVAPLLPDSFYWPAWFTFTGSAPAWDFVYRFLRTQL